MNRQTEGYCHCIKPPLCDVGLINIKKQYVGLINIKDKTVTSTSKNKNLERWTADADCYFLMSADDSLAMTKDLKTVLKECRLDRYEVLEVRQRYGTFQQLPA